MDGGFRFQRLGVSLSAAAGCARTVWPPRPPLTALLERQHAFSPPAPPSSSILLPSSPQLPGCFLPRGRAPHGAGDSPVGHGALGCAARAALAAAVPQLISCEHSCRPRARCCRPPTRTPSLLPPTHPALADFTATETRGDREPSISREVTSKAKAGATPLGGSPAKGAAGAGAGTRATRWGGRRRRRGG